MDEKMARTSQSATGSDGELLAFLELRFSRFANWPALRRESASASDRALELSYADVDARSAATAEALRARGVAPGARVALLAENGPDWVTSLFGAWRAGATVVPLDPRLGDDEIVVLIGHARPHVVLSSEGQRTRAERAEREADVEPIGPSADAPALIIYTSGTTGRPKGVAITFANLMHQVRGVDAVIGPQGRERFLSILPLCHLYELICGLLVPLSRGAVISYPGTDSLLPADLTRIMRERRVTSLVGVPLLYRALARGIAAELRRKGRLARAYVAAVGALAAALPLPRLRRLLHAPILRNFGGHLHQLYSGGAALDLQVARTFERMGLPILQGYGLSETSPVISTNGSRSYRIGSVGRPLPGVEVRISPEGEIQARGPNVMRGYVDRPDLTAEVLDADGWLRTGDLGHLDDQGFLHVTGRAKDVIVLGGGKKVYPDEVEAVLADSPAFAEVVVLGARARGHGHEEVCAIVVPAPGASDCVDVASAEIARCLAGVASFKRPTRVVIRREPIPRTTTRKAKRNALAAWIDQLPAERAA